MDVTTRLILGFYIFQGERIKDDYIKHCKFGTRMVVQTKTWMTSFLFKEFFVIFQKVSSKWNLSKQLSSINSRWAWFTCQPKSNRTSSIVWARYDHLTFTQLPCFTTSKCELFQALQNNFYNNNNNSSMVNNNYKELDNIDFAN
jgi:hypothetical protein